MFGAPVDAKMIAAKKGCAFAWRVNTVLCPAVVEQLARLEEIQLAQEKRFRACGAFDGRQEARSVLRQPYDHLRRIGKREYLQHDCRRFFDGRIGFSKDGKRRERANRHALKRGGNGAGREWLRRSR